MHGSPEITPEQGAIWDIAPSIDVNVGRVIMGLHEDEHCYPLINMTKIPEQYLSEEFRGGLVLEAAKSGINLDKKIGVELGFSPEGNPEQRILLYQDSTTEPTVKETFLAPKETFTIGLAPKQWEIIPSIGVEAGQRFARKNPGKVLEINIEAARKALETLAAKDSIPVVTHFDLNRETLPILTLGQAERLSSHETAIRVKLKKSLRYMNETAWHELQHVTDSCSPKEDILNNMRTYPDTREAHHRFIRSAMEALSGATLITIGITSLSAIATLAGGSLVAAAFREGNKASKIAKDYVNHRSEVRAQKAEGNASEFPPIITIS